ncbi:RING U-box superfamily isoform 4 [Chlorella sorokiniana]|uniref:RING U-box superfamily isoform 4 n=1 Tax=Chlorella sorokiniana TaxID=3076 RepID=A0A2P6THY7_CHLSO|nr:RING U-box superfamily isoform 4 [Chlorella sorokiniana]|eukprot:PRW33898.1 RING U-box superfamily isoform 4 [Chlorella sorokiniana]
MRAVLEHRVGPWLNNTAPPALAAASGALDPIARSLLAVLCRSAYVRLAGSAFVPALDDLPLPPRAWASSSLQCFRYRAGSGGCEGHEDRALLTLIYAPGQPGLQVQDAGGQWRDVELGPKQLLVMAGHALEYATCGLIRSSRHWVVLEGAERRSLAYKLAAQPGATLNLVPALQAAGHDLVAAERRYPQPITYQQLMARFGATHRTANPACKLR